MTKVKKKRKLKKKFKFMIILFFLLLIIGGLVFNKDRFLNKAVEEIKESIPVVNKIIPKEEKTLQVFDVNSNSRNIAVMINNHSSARPYHSGLQDAHIVYEIIVEGGYTRYMAIFKDKNLDRIGSVRSARHYFLDYALENDAIYVHWGWSPEAENDIDELNIDNINGLSHEEYYFYRDNSLNIGYEHRGFSSSELIDKAIAKFAYRDTTEKSDLFKYSIDEVDISSMDDAVAANVVTIPYSGIVTTSYIYDAESKVYKRYVNDAPHIDYTSKEQYYAKNIITYKVSTHTLNGDVKGRQEIDNIGTGEGYYISNGYAVPIVWTKKSRSAKTVYTYKDGTEIKVNDGNTFIQIQPNSQKFTIN